MSLDLAWDISDTFNGLMAIPNLIGVLTLSGTVIRITKNYVARTFKGSKEKPMLSAFDDVQREQELKL
jgi:AGCS family alanine or glycine:cation symporter